MAVNGHANRHANGHAYTITTRTRNWLHQTKSIRRIYTTTESISLCLLSSTAYSVVCSRATTMALGFYWRRICIFLVLLLYPRKNKDHYYGHASLFTLLGTLYAVFSNITEREEHAAAFVLKAYYTLSLFIHTSLYIR